MVVVVGGAAQKNRCRERNGGPGCGWWKFEFDGNNPDCTCPVQGYFEYQKQVMFNITWFVLTEALVVIVTLA